MEHGFDSRRRYHMNKEMLESDATDSFFYFYSLYLISSFRLQQLAEGLMPVPAHQHRETFSHHFSSYGYILYGRVANPLYIDVRLVAHGLVSVLRKSLVSLVA